MSAVQKILILDFGGQYTQLIARRVRECHVYSEVIPWNFPLDEIRVREPAGIILSGGPSSVHDENAPSVDPGIYSLGIPVLGICYGMQLTAHLLGGAVERAKEREYGRIEVRMKESSSLLAGMKSSSFCWMSHTWQV
ncbi:MAG: gamma-glutamyl-gamma-aminobutyrate hydrolase family protein, partial [Clostridia bacterium]|nr:gamma-glutamyl-gamma-aminobutyrate hydrolase family protein [Clostridia bacterium]